MVPVLVTLHDGSALRTDLDTLETLLGTWPDLDCRLPVQAHQSGTTLLLKGLNPRYVALVSEIPE